MGINGGFKKNMVKMLFVAALLCIFAAGTFAAAAPTVVYSPLGGNYITPNTPIYATISGYGATDSVVMVVSVSGNSATSYQVPTFTLPFQLDASSLSVSGTNVDKVTISVTDPDSTVHSVTNYAIPSTLLTGYTAKAGTYSNNGVSINATAQPTSVSLTINGKAHAAISGKKLTLDTTGATDGSIITVNIGGQSATYTVSTSQVQTQDSGSSGGSGSGGVSTGIGVSKGPVVAQAPVAGNGGVSVTTPVSIGTGSLTSGPISLGGLGSNFAGSTLVWSSTNTNTPGMGATVTTTVSTVPDSTAIGGLIQSALGANDLSRVQSVTTVTVTSSGTSLGPGTLSMTVPASMIPVGGVSQLTIVQVTDSGQANIFTQANGGLTAVTDPTTGMTTLTISPSSYCTFELMIVQPIGSATGNAAVTATTTTDLTGATVTAQNTILPAGSDTAAPAASVTPGSASATATKTPLSLFVPLSALVIAIIGLALRRKQ